MSANCPECVGGSPVRFHEPWGIVHADEGCPMPMPCSDPLRAVLKSVEWKGWHIERGEKPWPNCPSCGSPSPEVQFTDVSDDEGGVGVHMPECALAAAIGAPKDKARKPPMTHTRSCSETYNASEGHSGCICPIERWATR